MRASPPMWRKLSVQARGEFNIDDPFSLSLVEFGLVFWTLAQRVVSRLEEEKQDEARRWLAAWDKVPDDVMEDIHKERELASSAQWAALAASRKR